MFFRFGSAVVLAVLISLTGGVLERHNLELRRRISHQEYRKSILQERRAELTLQVQELGSPERLIKKRGRTD